MKFFSQFALRFRTGRKHIPNSSTSASRRALVRNFSTSSPEAGKHASAVSGDSLLIAGALTVASGGVLYFAMRQLDALEEAKAVVGPEPKSPETFTFRHKTLGRGLVEYMVSYPGDKEAEKLLLRHEISRSFKPTTSNGVVRFDNNWVGCNEPCEDRHVESYLSRDILQASPVRETCKTDTVLRDQPEVSNLKLFSMIDGHGGCATADALAKDLHPRVIKSLQSLYSGKKPSAIDPMLAMRLFQRGDYRSFLQSYFTMEGAHKNASSKVTTPTNKFISDALASAYTGLDFDICSAPLRLLSITNPAAKVQPDVKCLVEPAINGACALTVLVDEDRQEIYVANTGDSRAVAGYYVQPHTASNGIHFQGGWRCEVLTEDQTAKSSKETQRLQKEHPGEEEHLLCDNGRVLGDLMPARAFGDAKWLKWTSEETEAIDNLKWSEDRWKPPLFDVSKHKTPPYVTAKPEITCKSLAGDESMGQLKFIILATDGLWDHITSDEAVGLVSTHLTHPKHAPLEREKVQDSLIPQRKDSAAKYPGGREKGEELRGSWAYQDKNAATHLIRNAFEACKFMPDAGKQVICAKPPIARWIRDDVTCSVIFFGDAAGEIFPSSKDRTASKEV